MTETVVTLASVLLVETIGLALVLLGWLLAREQLRTERERLRCQRSALDAEWRALAGAHQVRATVRQAGQAMHQQAGYGR
ncbi:hypothetical protein GCM10023321_37710 [Pseudonocardia eucalypti]|uniref:Uncharacterized protein n=1 Tax=Pseudonocardia eucalypti TaxID=648755 RepID=A0ABP9Q7U8_9PSEU|nr:cell division protein FtsL [Pseudonocardia eucalypti]